MRFAWLVTILPIIAGCAHIPKAGEVCQRCEKVTLLSATSLPMIAWLNESLYRRPGRELPTVHVYLEGDGRNWWWGRIPPANPTSRQFTALKLMNLDRRAALYLNRPCYGWESMPEACGYSYWTDGRYSAKVVERLDRALDELKARLGDARLVLIGHSGGGSLAMLLAERRTDVIGVVTLAANLDHRHWTELQGYDPLHNSLNASDVQLPDHIIRWHFAGGRDTQVPAEVTAQAAASDPLATFELVDAYDHSCCWQNLWPEVLRKLAEENL